MGKRKFKLPGEEDTNKDQDRVCALPEDGQFLIVGGPGTGKSVVALLRALKFHINNDYVFLTYNHVLSAATKQLVDNNLKIGTIQSWFYKMQLHYTKELMPQFEEYKPDYNEVIKRFESLEMNISSLHLIIDEGQDMPPLFYDALTLRYENFFIVADQNQQLTDENSSIKELADLLDKKIEGDDNKGKEGEYVIKLKENYRNSYPIAQFAGHFFTDPSSPPPDLPPKSRTSLGTPILFEYENFQDCIKIILREADKDDRNLIGVVVANNGKRKNYAKELNSLEINLENQRPKISTYSNGDKDINIDFSEGGIVILNDKSTKGIEFDIIYIIIDEFNIYNNDTDSMKKRFYVMSSRAIKKLVLFKHKNYNGGVDEILPDDESILKREKVNNG